MNNQTFIFAAIVLCSLGGWYVVITKYLALKRMIKDSDDEMTQHIPGMGPPPVGHTPFAIPPELLANSGLESPKRVYNPAPSPVIPPTTADEKREICNQTCVMHLLGFGIVTGVPFLNVILPTMFWLWKKEQHPYLAKQGREVINFHITFTIIQFICLFGGILLIRFMPTMASKLFAWTKICRIVFSSGMYLPFNVFTVVPFFWACMLIIRGAVAAYHGINYKYPATQQFLFTAEPPKPQAAAANQMGAANAVPEPTMAPNVSGNRVTFG